MQQKPSVADISGNENSKKELTQEVTSFIHKHSEKISTNEKSQGTNEKSQVSKRKVRKPGQPDVTILIDEDGNKTIEQEDKGIPKASINESDEEKLVQEFMEKLQSFVNDIYLPNIPTTYELDNNEHWKRKPDKVKIPLRVKAKERESWRKYRETFLEKYKEIFENIDENAKNKPGMKSLKAMIAWEDVFLMHLKDGLRDRSEKALKYLMDAYEVGAYGIEKIKTEMVIASLADALLVARHFNWIEDSNEIKEFENRLYREAVLESGDTHGSRNEYRFIYLMRIADEPIIHSTPFQDTQESYRFDFSVLLKEKKEQLRLFGVQAKTPNFVGYYSIYSEIKNAYDIAIQENKTSPAEKKFFKKTFDDHYNRLYELMGK